MSDKITAFTRPNVRQLTDAMLAALKGVEKTYGVRIEPRGGTLGPTAVLKFEVAAVGADGVAQTIERESFTRFAHAYGLHPAWLDRTFTYRSVDYRLTGLNTKATRAPVLAVRVRDGRAFKFQADAVRLILGAQPEP
jgi:hypothetical protein